MLSVSLCPKVISSSRCHCNSLMLFKNLNLNFWNRFFNKYKNKSQPIYFFLHQWKMVVWSKVSFCWFQDEKQIKAHYTSKIFSIPIFKCNFLMDRKDSSFFSVSFGKLSFDLIFSLTLEVDVFFKLPMKVQSLFDYWAVLLCKSLHKETKEYSLH